MTLEVPEFWTRVNFRRAHRIDLYEKATIVQRDLTAGAWLIEGIPTTSPAAADLEAGGGIIIYYRGQVLDSGRVEQVDELDAYDENANGFVSTKAVNGPLDLAYVVDRRAHPDPITLDTTINESATYSGAAETALKHMVNDNLGPGAHPSRVQPNFTIAPDLGRGTAIFDQVRFTPTADLLANWCVVGGIIPTCKAVGGELVFDVYVPRDLRRFIVISIERGTALRARRVESAPSVTYEWVGLQGDGVARIFVERGDSAAQLRWGFRREVLADRRDTNDPVVGDQQLTADLATGASSLALEVDPIDLIDARFGTDYQLGDIVTGVTAQGIVIARQVREVRIECTPEKVVRFSPLLADPLTPSPEQLASLSRIRNLEFRIVNQEAR